MQIPPKSRLAEAIEEILSWNMQSVDAEEAARRIRQRFDERLGYDWCHVIPNAMIVCTGLLYGDLDFSRTMHICLTAAFDTDCNCATAGSVLGMILGADNIPAEWTAPLRDQDVYKRHQLPWALDMCHNHLDECIKFIVYPRLGEDGLKE